MSNVTLTEFLIARIIEDEDKLRREFDWPFFGGPNQRDQARASLRANLVRDQTELNVVNAKRMIVALHSTTVERDREFRYIEDLHFERFDDRVICATCGQIAFVEHAWERFNLAVPTAEAACNTLKALGLMYSDHPDYDESWRRFEFKTNGD